MKYKYKMKRQRRRLFTQVENIARNRKHPFYLKHVDKYGGWPKLHGAAGGRVGGDFWEERLPSGSKKNIKRDYQATWKLQPIRKKGQSSVKQRLPKLALPMRRRGNPKIKAPVIRSKSPQLGQKQEQDSIKLIRRRGPMVIKKTQVKRPPDKIAESMTNSANKFHSDGIKTGSRGYAGATKPTLTSTSSKPLEPMSLERKSVKTSMSNNAFEKRSIHHIKFKTGFKPTNPVFRLAKDNGTVYRTLLDTKQSWTTDLRRSMLNHACGFNSRSFIIPPRDSFVSVRDVVEDVFDLFATPTTTKPTISGSRYGCLMSTVSQFMIHNQSPYMPCKVIAHLCQVDQPRVISQTELTQYLESHIFNDIATVQWTGAVPTYYQHGNSIVEQESTDSNTRTVHCDMSYKGKGLYDSTNFKNNFTIVKSESVRLEAGDFLNLSHAHECGPGIDLGKLHSVYGTSTGMKNAPFSFFVILELQGYECEGLYKSPSALNTYIGKSPAYISYEFKKSYLGASEAPYPDSNSLPVLNQIAIRDFASESIDVEDASTGKEFFVLPENIVGTVPLVAGTLSVAVATDKDRVIHTTTSDHNGTEMNP